MQTSNILELKNLSLSFHQNSPILKNLNYTFSQNYYFLTGPNGSGKTSLLNCISNTISFNGQILFNNQEIKFLSPLEISKILAYLPQTFNPTFNISVLDFLNAFYSSEKLKLLRNQKIHSCYRLLELLKIDYKNNNISNLSAGQKKKLLLAAFLCEDHKIFLLDETFSSIDQESQKILREILTKKVLESRICVIEAIHGEIPSLNCSYKILEIKNGNLLESKESKIISEKSLEIKPNISITETIKNPPIKNLYSFLSLVLIAALTLILGNLYKLDSFSPEIREQILFNIRLPRTLLAFISGAALSVSGLVLQTLFQNPLASPYTTGISASAALGVAVSNIFFTKSLLPSLNINLFSSLIGATFGSLVMLSVIKFSKNITATSLIIIGVVLNYIFSSLLLLIQYLSDPSELYALTKWLIGNISILDYDLILCLLSILLLSIIYTQKQASKLDLLNIGLDIAKIRGLDIKNFRFYFFLIFSLLISLTVSLVGPIGFVGIVIPHITRMILGYSHKTNILGTSIVGGIFLALCDILARNLGGTSELPVGLISTLIGGSIFVILLVRKKENLSN